MAPPVTQLSFVYRWLTGILDFSMCCFKTRLQHIKQMNCGRGVFSFFQCCFSSALVLAARPVKRFTETSLAEEPGRSPLLLWNKLDGVDAGYRIPISPPTELTSEDLRRWISVVQFVPSSVTALHLKPPSNTHTHTCILQRPWFQSLPFFRIKSYLSKDKC